MAAWTSLHEFISRRAPAFDRKAIPVPIEAIRETERGLGIRFPQVYVDFLCTAGELSGPFAPFSTRFNANFYDIVDRVSRGTEYPIERYWPAGLRIDLDGDFHDPFIDLGHADGEDAPLVTFEPRTRFDTQEIVVLMYTLAEELAANAFADLEMERRKHSTAFVMSPERESFVDALEYLELFGLTETMHASPRLRIFEGSGPVAVAVFDWEGHIAVDVAGEDYQLCWRVIDVLRNNISGLCSGIDL